MPAPQPTEIYHITALANLPKIAASQALICKRRLDLKKASFQSIAYADLQDRRGRKVVRPNQTLHDFVPFTFAPRSPMLKVIHSGGVPAFSGGQEGIAHLISTAQAVAGAGLDFLFTDFHAIVAYAQFYNDLTDLSKVDWNLFFEAPRIGGYCKYWNSKAEVARYAKRSETRQAEFLVHDMFPCELIHGIGVANAEIASALASQLKTMGWGVPVKAVPEWYY